MSNNNKYRTGKIFVSITDISNTLLRVKQAVSNGMNDYICVASIRSVFTANSNPEYADIINNAMMCLPDGMPLVCTAKLWGVKNVERTSGPELFIRLLQDPSNGIRHFLLGDTEETLAAMKEKYSNSLIVGSYSPPFCKVDEFDYLGIANMIKESGANIVWIALQAPKQDFFSVKILPYLKHTLCIGVGAAFRFSLGQYKMPPMIYQKLGLTGLFWRKMNKAILNDYLHAIPCVFRILAMAFIGRLVGKKYYK